jgi:hypothetical protein
VEFWWLNSSEDLVRASTPRKRKDVSGQMSKLSDLTAYIETVNIPCEI